MADLLLAEELFLLTHDDASGKADLVTALDRGLAGALLLDLAADGLVVTEGDDLRAVGGTARTPLLAAAHEAIAGSDTRRTTKAWLNKLPGQLKPLITQVGQALAERGILDERYRKVLGLFPSRTWPELDPGPERELRKRLKTVLEDGADPDPRTSLLISLLSPLSLVKSVVDKPHRKEAEARAKEIAKASAGGPTGKALGEAVQAIQAALFVAIIVPAVVSSTGS